MICRLLMYLVFLAIFFDLDAVNRGLTNTGDDCFINASLQALSHVKRFRDIFLHEVKIPDDSKNIAAQEFIALMHDLVRPTETTPIESWRFRKTFTCGGPVAFNRPDIDDYQELSESLGKYFDAVEKLAIDLQKKPAENSWENNKEKFEVLNKEYPDVGRFLTSLSNFYSAMSERLVCLKKSQLIPPEAIEEKLFDFDRTWTSLRDVKLSEQQKKKPELLSDLFRIVLLPLTVKTKEGYNQFIGSLTEYEQTKIGGLKRLCQSFVDVVQNKRNWVGEDDESYIARVNETLGKSHPIGQNTFKLGTQQNDPQEFINQLFDVLREEKDIKTVLERECKFIAINCTKCLGCTTVFKKEEAQFWLMFALDQAQNIETLDTIMKKYFATENMTGANKYQCSVCGSKQNAEKYVRLRTLPHVLLVQLKRYNFDYASMRIKKTHTIVPIPQEFSFVKNYLDLKEPVNSIYRLRSVVLHSGATSALGHYTAFARDIHTGAWIYFDDTRRYEISGPQMDKILNMGFFIPVRSDTSIKQSELLVVNAAKDGFELSPSANFEDRFDALLKKEAEDQVVVVPAEVTAAQVHLEKNPEYMKKIRDDLVKKMHDAQERERIKSKKKTEKTGDGIEKLVPALLLLKMKLISLKNQLTQKGDQTDISLDAQVDAQVKEQLKKDAKAFAEKEKIKQIIAALKTDPAKNAQFQDKAKKDMVKNLVEYAFQPYLLFYEKAMAE